MTQICQCGKPTRDDAYVCDACLDDLAKALGNVPALAGELDVSLTRVKGIDYTEMGGSRGAETPLPLDQRAYEAISQLRAVLVSWTRFCSEEGVRNQSPRPGLPADTLQAMSAWLLWRVDGLGFSDLGPDAVSEITRAVGRCQMVIDRPAERRYAGPCECGRDLYNKPGEKITTCRACGKAYDVEAMGEWMRAGVAGRLVTAFEGATLLCRFDLPIKQATIDKWFERKRLTSHGTDTAGSRLYLIDDLIHLAANAGAKSA